MKPTSPYTYYVSPSGEVTRLAVRHKRAHTDHLTQLDPDDGKARYHAQIVAKLEDKNVDDGIVFGVWRRDTKRKDQTVIEFVVKHHEYDNRVIWIGAHIASVLDMKYDKTAQGVVIPMALPAGATHDNVARRKVAALNVLTELGHAAGWLARTASWAADQYTHI